jgi:hypothetical protein
MTRQEALATVRRLAIGLPAEGGVDSAVARLMERISSTEDAELLRDALTEAGARALLRDRRPPSGAAA